MRVNVPVACPLSRGHASIGMLCVVPLAQQLGHASWWHGNPCVNHSLYSVHLVSLLISSILLESKVFVEK